jgi:hypothetical protein
MNSSEIDPHIFPLSHIANKTFEWLPSLDSGEEFGV